MKINKKQFLIFLVMLIILGWAFRYETVPTIDPYSFYRMNRWTGTIEKCDENGCESKAQGWLRGVSMFFGKPKKRNRVDYAAMALERQNRERDKKPVSLTEEEFKRRLDEIDLARQRQKEQQSK